MRVPLRLLCAVALCTSIPSAAATAQHSTSAERSARSGVYTAEQATRGKDLYALKCRSCHTPETHTGVIFDTWWGGKLVSDLFQYVQDQMPKNEPGSLLPEEIADVIAYIFLMNRLATGTEELSTDVAVLRKIRIEKAK